MKVTNDNLQQHEDAVLRGLRGDHAGWRRALRCACSDVAHVVRVTDIPQRRHFESIILLISILIMIYLLNAFK